MALARLGVAALLVGGALAPPGIAATAPDPAAALEDAMSAAESSLRDGELQSAESHYRDALLEGWLLMGSLEATGGRLPQARDALRRAGTVAVETQRPRRSLALVHLRMGEAKEAVELLAPLATRNPSDTALRRLLAQALASSGQPERAVQELEEARAVAPGDLEVVFALATGYLKLKRAEAAERLFEGIVKERPIPQTHVLIGRTYRDFGEYDRARVELLAALKQDPRVLRAHYYLGTVGVMSEGPARLEEAIGEFHRELEINPGDPLTSLRLGIALMESRRPEEALPVLEAASRARPPAADAFHYLGRAQLALDRPGVAAASLKRALELVGGPVVDPVQLGSIHYNLALALRKRGDTEEAAAHFSAAELASARIAESARERLSRYMRDSPDPETSATLDLPVGVPLDGLAPPDLFALAKRVTAALAQACLNLGVMQAQKERYPRAVEMFEMAAEVDPVFPKVQYSLGVARFNAQQFDKATGPLSLALAEAAGDVGLRRMLAIAWLNAEAYEKAAELLRDDPGRDEDASLQYAYALALVRSNRASEAEPIFGRLLARHGDTAELNVMLGQAHAQQGDYDGAVRSLKRALELKPDVAEANAALGVIYLKQGQLPEAEQALRAEVTARPADVKSAHNLATVLDLQGRPEEALALLRTVLKAKPDFADARYLFGKVLLSQGAAEEAAQHLEAAARLAPEDANVHYQLGQAYQKLGRVDAAREQFEVFQKLKDKRRGGTS
jgi:tetratricopeptide (TPR) repeat protein